MAADAIHNPFSPCGLAAGTKLLLLGLRDSHAELLDRACSLNLEHVSSCALSSRGISRPADEAATVARMRRWFFARKPDAGFLMTDFPATLLQAKVLDEWLDSRDEALDGVLTGPGASPHVLSHYRTLGLLSGPLFV